MRITGDVRAFLIVVALVLSASQMWGQSGSGIIFGTVADSSGAVVPNAGITVTNVATGVSVTAKSDAAGEYIVSGLRAATYRLSCTATGFSSEERTGVVLEVDQRSHLDFALQVGATQQVVQVTEGITNIDTFSSTVQDVVDSTRMVELPLNGRNALTLQGLLPGAVQMGTGSAATGVALNTNLVFSVNGARPNQSAYTLDGALNMDMFNNTPAAFPNPDMLQEFSILQNGYNAVTGRNAGAVINMITKSGTNSLHGTAYDFLRNSYADSRDYFSTVVPPLRRNQFGGTIGGPVVLPFYHGKDHTFFFMGAELVRQSLGSTVSGVVVPTSAERSGNFSAAEVKAGSSFVPLVIRNPATGLPLNTSNVPVDPVAAAFAKSFLPDVGTPGVVITPNSKDPGTELAAFNPVLATRENQLIVKADEVISSNDKLGFRYFFDDSFNQQNAGLPAINSGNDWTTHNGVINEAHSFNTHIANMFTFMVNRNTFIRAPLVTSPANWAALGCESCVPLGPPSIPTDWAITIAGGPSVRVATNYRSFMMNYQTLDVVSWTMKNHLFQFGGEIGRARRYGQEYYQFSPLWTFDGTLSTSSAYGYADFFLGQADSVFQNSPLRSYQYKWNPFLYFQDDWRVTTRLTLNLGVRWEPYVTTRDALGHDGAFRPGLQSTVLPNAPLGALFPGDSGIGPGVTPNRYDRFSPRIGFAFDPFGNGKTSIRGAYGIFSDTLRLAGLNTNALNQPFSFGWTTSPNVNTTTHVVSEDVTLTNPYANHEATLTALEAFTPPTTQAAKQAYQFTLPMTENSIDPKFTTGYSQQYNFSIQRETWKQVVLTVAYVGAVGRHEFLTEEINPAVYAPGATSNANNVNSRRIYTNFTTITNVQSTGSSSYNSLQISWNRRFTNGFTILGSYVYANSMDIASNDGNTGLSNQASDPFDIEKDYGLSDFDVRHRFTTSFVYNLRNFKQNRALDLLAGGWQLNGILTLQDGLPFTVLSGTPTSMAGVNLDHADVNGPVTIYNGKSDADKVAKYFDTSAFSLPALGTFGTSGRNILRGPGYADFDTGLFKNFTIHDQSHLEVRWEVFNALNHANFTNPNATWNSSLFGQLTATKTGAGRVMQIAAKIVF